MMVSAPMQILSLMEAQAALSASLLAGGVCPLAGGSVAAGFGDALSQRLQGVTRDGLDMFHSSSVSPVISRIFELGKSEPGGSVLLRKARSITDSFQAGLLSLTEGQATIEQNAVQGYIKSIVDFLAEPEAPTSVDKAAILERFKRAGASWFSEDAAANNDDLFAGVIAEEVAKRVWAITSSWAPTRNGRVDYRIFWLEEGLLQRLNIVASLKGMDTVMEALSVLEAAGFDWIDMVVNQGRDTKEEWKSRLAALKEIEAARDAAVAVTSDRITDVFPLPPGIDLDGALRPERNSAAIPDQQKTIDKLIGRLREVYSPQIIDELFQKSADGEITTEGFVRGMRQTVVITARMALNAIKGADLPDWGRVNPIVAKNIAIIRDIIDEAFAGGIDIIGDSRILLIAYNWLARVAEIRLGQENIIRTAQKTTVVIDGKNVEAAVLEIGDAPLESALAAFEEARGGIAGTPASGRAEISEFRVLAARDIATRIQEYGWELHDGVIASYENDMEFLFDADKKIARGESLREDEVERLRLINGRILSGLERFTLLEEFTKSVIFEGDKDGQEAKLFRDRMLHDMVHRYSLFHLTEMILRNLLQNIAVISRDPKLNRLALIKSGRRDMFCVIKSGVTLAELKSNDYNFTAIPDETRIVLEDASLKLSRRDLHVFGDIVANLVSNGWRYGEGKIRVSLSGERLSDGSLMLTFSSNGIGVLPQNLRLLGGRGFREGRREVEGSSGIGLSLVIEYLERLGAGPLWVKSEGDGKGLHVRFVLPEGMLEWDAPEMAEAAATASEDVSVEERNRREGFIVPDAARRKIDETKY